MEKRGVCCNSWERKMKYGSIICTTLFVIGVVLSLVQLWFSPFEAEIFTKILITLAAIFVIALGVSLVFKEYISDKEMKKKGYIDE